MTADNAPIRTRLKWFNGPKGFGFVVPEDDGGDAFLHITTLQRAGITALGEGACLLCHLVRGPKGAQVTEIITLLEPGASPELIQVPSEGIGGSEETIALQGTVKWYKPEKGFGFITPDDGKKDVFIHQTCLDRYGFGTLPAGKRVSMDVKCVAKGREVVDFRFLEE